MPRRPNGDAGIGVKVWVGSDPKRSRDYAWASLRAAPEWAAPVWTSIIMLSPFLHREPSSTEDTPEVGSLCLRSGEDQTAEARHV